MSVQNDKLVSVFMPKAIFKQLKKKAVREDRSVSAVVRLMITENLEKENAKNNTHKAA